MRNGRYRLDTPSLLPAGSRPSLASRIGLLAILALAGAFTWLEPLRNGPAALALVAAFVLDGVGRRAALSAARRRGIVDRARGLPSLLLILATPVGAALGCLVGVLILGLDRFAIVAGLLAGIVAMTAIARLVAARSMLTFEEGETGEG